MSNCCKQSQTLEEVVEHSLNIPAGVANIVSSYINCTYTLVKPKVDFRSESGSFAIHLLVNSVSDWSVDCIKNAIHSSMLGSPRLANVLEQLTWVICETQGANGWTVRRLVNQEDIPEILNLQSRWTVRGAS